MNHPEANNPEDHAIAKAIAHNCSIAVSNLMNSQTAKLTGRDYDPFGDVWHWTSPILYEAGLRVANTMLNQRPDEWQPADPEYITDALKPEQTITLPDDDRLNTAQRIAALDTNPYLMAMADARSAMRKMYNGTTTATFPNKSHTHIDPLTRTVRDTGSPVDAGISPQKDTYALHRPGVHHPRHRQEPRQQGRRVRRQHRGMTLSPQERGYTDPLKKPILDNCEPRTSGR